MTKDEYEKLLQSDYWRGYSFSIIKERNFTCEDCGRSFPNERNKLQVHHLVYRDVNPWSYKPEEVVVLCEECHKKRHGIITDTEQVVSIDSKDTPKTNENNYTTSYDTKSYRKEQSIPERKPFFQRHKSLYIAAAIVCLIIVLKPIFNDNAKVSQDNIIDETSKEIESTNTSPSIVIDESNNHSKNIVHKKTSNSNTSSSSEVFNSIDNTSTNIHEEVKRNKTTLELLEEKNHADVVKQAQKAGVSTEGSTIEILERINHADVIKQAQKAGVSTEGSTIEILERINHADVIKQAQKAGVSTEGSTTEILERINHADVIKQAQKAGVSTEGSTTEILERIMRKSLESN